MTAKVVSTIHARSPTNATNTRRWLYCTLYVGTIVIGRNGASASHMWPVQHSIYADSIRMNSKAHFLSFLGTSSIA